MQRWLIGLTMLGFLIAGGRMRPAAAQALSGTGQQATELFTLPEGLAVWEVEHRGTGRFTVRLLDERGALVAVLAEADGAFTGSKAAQIPRAGRYLLDVAASGAWTARLREARPAGMAGPDPTPNAPLADSPGWEAGRRAAGNHWSWGWFGRGLVAGAAAGPVGGAIAAGLAGHGRFPEPALGGVTGADPLYDAAFRAGFRKRLVQERRKAAFVGSMAGTAVFVYWVLQLVEIQGQGGGGGDNGGGPGPVVIRLPVR